MYMSGGMDECCRFWASEDHYARELVAEPELLQYCIQILARHHAGRDPWCEV